MKRFATNVGCRQRAAMVRPVALAWSMLALGLALILTTPCRGAGGDDVSAPAAHWLWPTRQRRAGQTAYFRKAFDVRDGVASAVLYIVADSNSMTIYLNGKRVAEATNYGPMVRVDVTRGLQRGRNVLAVRGRSDAAPPAINVRLVITYRDKTHQLVATDPTWLATLTEQRAWNKLDFKPKSWSPAVSFGELADEPWRDLTNRIAINRFDDYEQWRQATGAPKGTDPSAFHVAPGFEIEMLRSAQKGEGSWVSMAFDPKGRLVIAKESKGLLRLTLSNDKKPQIRVEPINDTLLECRGLLFAHGALYANANNSLGLYRLRDTNGDDRFDEVKLLYKSSGGVGHGRNDLALGPDGMVYSIHGDAVDPPTGFVNLTSPFRAHSRGQRSREGHLIRMDADGNARQFVAGGLRNPFGIDFNPDGEMFTYDADAEFDMGSPWYRPTRVRHLVSGADYRWRGVTGSWPPYFPDSAQSPPATLDIGKGSPTAVKIGTRSSFSAKFQRALFILDWAYGRIMAVHMTPRGASYGASAETFVKGRPLNVTDLDFGPDGAMYFVTGGRKTQSALYRVRYTGPRTQPPARTAQQEARSRHAMAARQLRRRLERFHGHRDPRAVAFAWPHLSNHDPWIRHAARIAVEHQPTDTWRDKALTETEPTTALTALMSLAAGGDGATQAPLLTRLNKLTTASLTTEQKLIALRAYELSFNRMGKPTGQLARQTTAALDARYPDESSLVNQAISLLLVDLNAPSVVPKTLKLLAAAPTQKQRMHCLFVLRNQTRGWTLDGRRLYFQRLRESSQYLGGAGMPGFVKRIRSEAVATLTDAERRALGSLIDDKPARPVVDAPDTSNRKFVRQWKMADLAGALDQVGRNRDLKRGRQMFAVASCVRCHTFAGQGYPVGPDLTSLASRFSRRDMLGSIIEPSSVVADPYRNVRIKTRQGEVIVGRIVPGGDYRATPLEVMANLLEPDKVVKIAKKNIVSHEPSPISPMPQNLLDTLSKDEILDLLAYLESGGRTKPATP